MSEEKKQSVFLVSKTSRLPEGPRERYRYEHEFKIYYDNVNVMFCRIKSNRRYVQPSENVVKMAKMLAKANSVPCLRVRMKGVQKHG